MKRQGFTLIELLTVIAIIALLVGILVPVLGSARDSARALLCATNLRSLQTAMTQFAADNSSRYGGGLAKEWVTDDTWGVWWGEPAEVNIAGRGDVGDSDYVPSGDIWGYLQEPDVYLCPIFERICTGPPGGVRWAPDVLYGTHYARSFYDAEGVLMKSSIMPNKGAGNPVRSYALNERLAPYAKDANDVVYRKTDYTVLGDPKAIWLTEVHPWCKTWRDPETGNAVDVDDFYGLSRAHFGQLETPAQLHNGKANCSFGDGHVERLGPAEINANVTPPE